MHWLFITAVSGLWRIQRVSGMESALKWCPWNLGKIKFMLLVIFMCNGQLLCKQWILLNIMLCNKETTIKRSHVIDYQLISSSLQVSTPLLLSGENNRKPANLAPNSTHFGNDCFIWHCLQLENGLTFIAQSAWEWHLMTGQSILQIWDWEELLLSCDCKPPYPHLLGIRESQRVVRSHHPHSPQWLLL